jgi:heme-degrading monooxygenase HmoA
MDAVILRRWSSRIRTRDEEEYIKYITNTGFADYTKTPGNLGAEILVRTIGDGSSEVTTLSWWSSWKSIRDFAGAEPELARYYPEDRRFLLNKPRSVEHHRVVKSTKLKSNPSRARATQ